MGSRRARPRRPRRRLCFERLEDRTLLTVTDLAAITGFVFADVTGDGFTPGEQIPGASVELYRDANGNGSWDAGDIALGSTSSDANGAYRFDRLTAGDYFVRQPAQTVGAVSLSEQLNSLQISAADAQGILGTSLDSFTTTQTVVAALPLGTPAYSAVAAPEALGGERDMIGVLSAGTAVDALAMDSGSGRLNSSATSGAAGTLTVVWDGPDGDGANLNATGLRSGGQGIDLTGGGVSQHVLLTAGTDQSGNTARLRVYTDAANFSEATIPLAVGVSQDYLLSPATDFTVAGGTGADFANVGAVVLEMDVGTPGTDSQVSSLQMRGPTLRTANFAHVQTADLSLTKTASSTTPNVGQNVTFTVTIGNAGPATATNVVVSDLLPAGLTYVAATPSQGSYNPVTGQWTVGTVVGGSSAVLQLVATVTAAGTSTNTAQVTAADQFDPDSTPNNNVAAEDDQASITIVPTSLVDLSISMAAAPDPVAAGGQLTYTLTVTNSGPSTATGVTMTDVLPSQVTFLSAVSSQGTVSHAGSTLTANLGTLPAGASVTVVVVTAVGVGAAGVISNSATVSANEMETQPANNSDSQATVVTATAADLSLTLSVDDSAPGMGQEVTFTATLSNAGPAAATNVVVRDVLPAGLRFVRAAPSQGTYASATGQWTVGTLADGGSAQLQLTAEVTAAGTIANTAEVTAADQGDPDSTPNNGNPGEDDQAGVTLTPRSVPVVDPAALDGTNGFRLNGTAAGEQSGISVSGIGDINGDGFDDVLIGVSGGAGASYVVFGRARGFPATLELGSLDGADGFRLQSSTAGFGFSVSGAGDVNGDGLDDFVVGGGPAGGAGGAHVVFGRAGGFPAVLDVAGLDGTDGFRIAGEAGGWLLGLAVSGAGDVNGDGFDDVLVEGIRAGDSGSGQYVTVGYVVFGRGSGFPASLGVAGLDGSNGFRLDGVAEHAQDLYVGRNLSGAGDVNGDGLADVLIGDAFGRDGAGECYVVFGRRQGFPAHVALSSLDGTGGFRIWGSGPGFVGGEAGSFSGNGFGFSASSAGDVNGDGFDDVVLGAFLAGLPTAAPVGASYVVLGRAGGFPASLDVSTMEAGRGFRLTGRGTLLGFSLSSAGDFNGDGIDDLVLGAPGGDAAAGAYGTAASYVVFGRADGFPANLDLDGLDAAQGFALAGNLDALGRSVSGGGDVNGDGLDDLLIGAPLGDPAGRPDAGWSFVVFGAAGAEGAQVGDDGDNTLRADRGPQAADTLIGGRGHDTLASDAGPDTLRGGQGHDVLLVRSDDFRRLDGGTGTDTLRLDGSGLTIDLTALPDNRIRGVEVIDIRGSGPNTLRLSANDVRLLSDQTNTLQVLADADDTVALSGSWAPAGVQEVDGRAFSVYTRDGVTVLVTAPSVTPMTGRSSAPLPVEPQEDGGTATDDPPAETTTAVAATPAVADARDVVFASYGARNTAGQGSDRADVRPETSSNPQVELIAQAVHEQRAALTASVRQEKEKAGSALLSLLATEMEPLHLVALDLGDEVIDGQQATTPRGGNGGIGALVPPQPDPPSGGGTGTQLDTPASASAADAGNRLLVWLAVPLLFPVAAGAAWYWRKTWLKWFARVGWRAGLICLVCLGLDGRPGSTAEPPTADMDEPYVIAAEAAQRMARGEYHLACQTLQAGIAAARRSGTQDRQLAALLDLLAEVESLSGRHREAEATRRQYEELLGVGAQRNEPVRARSLRQSRVKLAEIQRRAGKFPAAEETLRAVLAADAADTADDPLERARWQLQLGQTIADGGEPARAAAAFAAAEQEARRALEAAGRGETDRVHAAQASLLVAECCAATQRWPDAVAALESLLATQDRDHPARSRTWCELARYQHAAGRHADEQRSLLQALADEQSSPANDSAASILHAAEIRDRLGQASLEQGDRINALRYWRDALEQYRAVCTHSDPGEAARLTPVCLRGLREIYLKAGDDEQACAAAGRLVEVLRRARLPDDPDFALAEHCLAGLLLKGKQYRQAQPHLQTARAYWEQRQPAQPAELAAVLNGLAEVARTTGDMREAAELFAQALARYEQAVPRDELTLAEVRVNLGAVAAALGKYGVAHDWYEQALRLCNQQRFRSPRADEVADAAWLNQAMLYKSQRQFEAALACCQTALGRREPRSGEQDPGTFPYHYTSAALYLARAEAGREAEAGDGAAGRAAGPPQPSWQEDLAMALSCADAARQTLEHQGSLAGFAGELAYLRGSILACQGAAEQAVAAWNEARQISEADGQKALQARVLTRQCEAELTSLTTPAGTPARPEPAPRREERLGRAEDLARQAIALHRETKAHPGLHFSALVNCAQVIRARLEGRHDSVRRQESRALLQEAIELTAVPRAMTTGAEAERAQFFSQYALAFDLLVDWCVKDGELWDALRYAESGRNRTYLDQVRAAGIDFGESLRGGQDEALLDRRRNLLFQHAAKRMQAALANAGSTAQDARQLSQELGELRDQLQQVETQIRERSPRYRNLLTNAESLPGVQELQALPQASELVLLYHAGKQRSHLFLLCGRDPSQPAAKPLELDDAAAKTLGAPKGPVNRQTLTILVQRYLTALQARRDLAGEARGVGKEVAAETQAGLTRAAACCLTDLLLPPAVRARLNEHTRLVIVPDGPLHQLPFEALLWPGQAGAATYVLDQAPPIAYAPSAQILTVLREQGSGPSPERSLLTVGNAVYRAAAAQQPDAAAPRRTAYEELGGELTPLPATAVECRRVEEACRRARFPRIDSWLGAEATEGHVRASLQDKTVLHFATHAFVDRKRDNCFGAIALTPPANAAETTPEDDGFLYLHEIHGLSLTHCDLAVLSACQTNVGPERPLEAGSTLARAFLAGGVKRVVCSLWNVSDDSTSLLIAGLFEQLSAGWQSGEPADYAAALHAARRQVRRMPQFAAPYYWAPFILIGPAGQ